MASPLARISFPGARPPRYALTTLLLGLLAGCAGLAPRPEPPTLALSGLSGVELRASDAKLTFRFEVGNPNDLELPVRGLEYRIVMMGDSFAEGMTDQAFVLPALGEAEFDMLVTTNFVSSFGRLLSRVQGGKLENIDYEITGKVMVDKGVVRKIPFNHRGTVDFTRATKAR